MTWRLHLQRIGSEIRVLVETLPTSRIALCKGKSVATFSSGWQLVMAIWLF